MRVCGDLPHGTQRTQRACPDETGPDAVRPLARLLRREAPSESGRKRRWTTKVGQAFLTRGSLEENRKARSGASRLGGGNGACMTRQLDSLHGTYPKRA